MIKKNIFHMKDPEKHIKNEMKPKAVDAGVFVELQNAYAKISGFVINMNKDIKLTIGYRLINILGQMITTFNRAYRDEDLKNKSHNITEIKILIEDVQLLSKVLQNSASLTLVQLAHICVDLGKIYDDLEKWEASIKNKLKLQIDD